ncbi:TIGR03761 family integrating conjugative element protein [Vibrio parahaemolyticus]|uniref:PFL_4669 family integrating conjugative element protein n=1 Tax=Vibrio parahaemolyticus TaxID=670 RepID=UPI001EEC89D4|nr:TIGR03761 family integrating conjugative element protein [Vibrio parahaemolyticus]MCG6490228.1 TIGR03761 family integrating conjugative element protein [Vibrio parahaemolyticus]
MMTDSTKNSAGTLTGGFHIELYTHYAAGIWNGRPGAGTKKKLIGVPPFLVLISRIHNDALTGNLAAGFVLSALEEKLLSAGHVFQQWQHELSMMIAGLPVNIIVSDVVSAQPLTVAVHCLNPLGYRFACLLAEFDQLALRILQAYHNGLISMKEKKARLHYCSHQIRSIFAVVLQYHPE